VEEDPVPSKMCLNNKILARVISFSYLGYSLSCTHDADIPNRIIKFIKVLGIIRSVMKPQLVQKHTLIKFIKSLLDQYWPMDARHLPVGRMMKSELEQQKCGL
jgi:hypothetical protein